MLVYRKRITVEQATQIFPATPRMSKDDHVVILHLTDAQRQAWKELGCSLELPLPDSAAFADGSSTRSEE